MERETDEELRLRGLASRAGISGVNGPAARRISSHFRCLDGVAEAERLAKEGLKPL